MSELKEYALAKVYANLTQTRFKIDDVEEDIKNKNLGGVTMDELQIVLKGHKKEEKVWRYIFDVLSL